MSSNDISHIDTPDESLLLRYIAGQTTEKEEQSVDEWAGIDIENEKALSGLARIYHAQKTRQNIDRRDTRSALLKVMGQIRRNLWRQRLQRVAVAASLIIGVVGIGSLSLNNSDSGEIVPSTITVSSTDNSRTRIELPDGTQVHLNLSSSITYPSHYTGDERKATLTGEAYFKVFRNEEMPFIVSTPDQKYNIRVLGTEFNMQAYEEDGIIQTSLISGSVEVDIDGRSTGTVLSPSQKAIYSLSTHELQVVTTDTDRETDWMYGRLVFKKTPMPEVLARLSRFYNIEFDVRNPVIRTYTFTGTFEDKPLFQVLDYMRISSGIENTITYRKDDDGTKSVVVLRK